MPGEIGVAQAMAGRGDFAIFGGTSFVAPQLNGATAVMDSALGHRIGFWNPMIYGFANSAHSPFTPLNSTTAFSGVRHLFQTSAKGVVTPVAGEFSNNNLFYGGKAGTTWIDTPPHPRGAKRPSDAWLFALENKGAGKTGCALHPRSRVQSAQRKRTRAYR